MMLLTRTQFIIIFIIAIYYGCHIVNAQETDQGHSFTNLAGEEVTKDSLELFLGEQMKALKVPGVSLAIINGGKVIFHLVKGYADVEQKSKVSGHTIFEGASLSKPLFAYFVMGFVEEGQLNLDKPLFEYLSYDDIDYDERYKKITARMVLSHTSGFPNWRSDYKEDKLFIKFDPGTAFEYSGEGYQYLAKVLMHILNTDDEGLEAIYQERIGRPLNLKYTKYVQDKFNARNKSKAYDDGIEIQGEGISEVFGAAFSIHSEASDFSKWVIALMEKVGLSPKSYDELFKTQVVLPEGHPQRQSGITDWTLGFAKGHLPFGTIYGHGGNNPGYSSLFVFEPQTKWGFVIFTNANQSQLPLVMIQYLMSP